MTNPEVGSDPCYQTLGFKIRNPALFAFRFMLLHVPSLSRPCSVVSHKDFKGALVLLLALSFSNRVTSNYVSPSHLQPGVIFTSEDCCRHLHYLARCLEPEGCSKEEGRDCHSESTACICACLNLLSWKPCVPTMRLVILDNYDLASEWAAKYICNRIIQFKPGQDRYFTLGLPTGSTPLGCYKKLIEYHKNGDLSFKYVKTFNMDEYVGLPRNHPESYHSYMWNNFFKHIDIDPNNAHILDGNATDLQAECDAFEKKIKEAGGIDLFVGGIGPDGHIAFNEPGSSLVSRTRLKTLAMDTILANAKYFDGDLSKVPTMALTVGVGTVMDAREVMILITGAHKAFALYKAIEEGVNHMWTVSAFQQHPRTIFVCDEDATLELRVKTVKYFKGLMHVHNKLVDPLYSMKEGN
uniref:Glucosamine-6-phosphate deaminase 2 n=10 Tax=Boreoeutheria TaxID=1437010 RepID=A0A8P0T614_CANLF